MSESRKTMEAILEDQTSTILIQNDDSVMCKDTWTMLDNQATSQCWEMYRRLNRPTDFFRAFYATPECRFLDAEEVFHYRAVSRTRWKRLNDCALLNGCTGALRMKIYFSMKSNLAKFKDIHFRSSWNSAISLDGSMAKIFYAFAC